MWVYLLAGIILAAIAWQDGKFHIIPDHMIGLLLLCGLVQSLLDHRLAEGVVGFVACGLPMLLFAIKLPEDIAGGDIKLCAALGALLGPLDGNLVILWALIGLSVFGLFGRKEKELIPYGPFVFPAYMAVIFLQWKGLI